METICYYDCVCRCTEHSPTFMSKHSQIKVFSASSVVSTREMIDSFVMQVVCMYFHTPHHTIRYSFCVCVCIISTPSLFWLFINANFVWRRLSFLGESIHWWYKNREYTMVNITSTSAATFCVSFHKFSLNLFWFHSKNFHLPHKITLS